MHKQAKHTIYKCPMHPDVATNIPGRCPRCGMKLEQKELNNNAVNDHKHGMDSNRAHDGHNDGMHVGHEVLFKRNFFIGIPITLAILALSPKIQEWFNFSLTFPGIEFVVFLLASIMVFYLGKPFYEMGWGEIKTKKFGMMTLVSLAVLSGYIFSVTATFLFEGESLYWEVSTLVLAFLFGHWIEMRAVRGATGALEELVKLIPQNSHLIKGKETIDIKTSELKVGDLILVKPGEKVPTDGEVVNGESGINESLLTGESRPITKKSGDRVIGGSLNGNGSLTVKVTKTGSETTVSQMMELVKSAQQTKPQVQRLADKAATFLTFTAILVGGGTFLFWFFVSPQGAVFAATLAISVIVITCPHALGLAIPTVATITSSIASKNGILIQNMTAIETAKKVNYVVFDKTGTLTEGKFTVSKIIKKEESNENEIISLASSIEGHSQHSIATGILMEAKKRKLQVKPSTSFLNITGKGAKGKVGKDEIKVGNKKLIKDWFEVDEPGTVVYVEKNNKVMGAIVLSDQIKPESKKAIELLHKMNIKIAMLTGDKKEVAESVSKQLNIDTVFSEVLPEDKVEKIKELQKNGHTVAMVGDGVNDAAALTQADIGIAIGAGTAVAASSSEIILVRNDPEDVVKAILLGRKTNSKMIQNLAWATGYNVFAIPLAAGVLYPYGVVLRPEWAAILMSASSVIVVLNAFLLRRIKL